MSDLWMVIRSGELSQPERKRLIRVSISLWAYLIFLIALAFAMCALLVGPPSGLLMWQFLAAAVLAPPWAILRWLPDSGLLPNRDAGRVVKRTERVAQQLPLRRLRARLSVPDQRLNRWAAWAQLLGLPVAVAALVVAIILGR